MAHVGPPTSDRTIKMQFSQALMQEAVRHYLVEKLMQDDVTVKKVEITEESPPGTHHFTVTMSLD